MVLMVAMVVLLRASTYWYEMNQGGGSTASVSSGVNIGVSSS